MKKLESFINSFTMPLIAEVQVVNRKTINALESVTVNNFSELKARKVLNDIEILVIRFTGFSAKWSKRMVAGIYKEGQETALINLLRTGYVKKVVDINHKGRIENMQKDTFAYLAQAVTSIKSFAARYVNSVRDAVDSMKQFPAQAQEFKIGGTITVDDIIADAIAKKEAVAFTKRAIMARLFDFVEDASFIFINGKNYNLKYYADLVARTELAKTFTQATLATMKEYGDDLVEFDQHDDACELCKEFEGNVYSLSGQSKIYPPLPPDANIPVHPNCLLPGTRCISPGGIIAGLRAWYSGKAIELSFSNGTKLSVTANHMFLTPQGFAPAHLLCNGDDIFCCPNAERIVSINPDYNGYPTLIEEIIESLSKSGGMTTNSVPSSAEYLHGDGRFCDGNIDIIAPNSFLRSTLESELLKRRNAHKFSGTNSKFFNFPGLGDFEAMFLRLKLAADGIMGGFRVPSPFFIGRSGHFDSLSVASGAGFTARSENSIPDTIPVNSDSFSNVTIKKSTFVKPESEIKIESTTFSRGDNQSINFCTETKPSINKTFSDCFFTNTKLLGDIVSGQSGLIEIVKVIGIRQFDYFGHVYDLQSYTSLYISNGILSSNCSHTLIPVMSEIEADNG